MMCVKLSVSRSRMVVRSNNGNNEGKAKGDRKKWYCRCRSRSKAAPRRLARTSLSCFERAERADSE